MRRALAVPAAATALSLAAMAPAAAATQANTSDGLSAAVTSTVIVSTLEGTGAGVYLGEGRVLTAAHVVPGETASLTGEGPLGVGRVTLRDERRDLALLELDSAPDLAPVDLRSGPARVGEHVYAAGAPMTDYVQLSAGIVSAVVEQDAVGMVQTDAAINPGNSGGPLLDESGDIVGIVVTKSGDDEGIGWATSSDEVTEFLGESPTAGSQDGSTEVATSNATAIPAAVSGPIAAGAALGATALVAVGLGRRRRKSSAPLLDLSDLAG